MTKYFKVVARGGHRGCSQSGELVFYVIANDAYHAMKKTQHMPAVKHHRSTPFSVVEVDYETYVEGKKTNAYGNYFSAKHER